MRQEKAPLPKERLANRTFALASVISTRYCGIVRDSIKEIKSGSRTRSIQENAFISKIVAISAIETFLSGYFQGVVEQLEEMDDTRIRFYKDFNNRGFGVRKQLREWPKMFFGKEYDQSDITITAFEELVDARNLLTHFKGGYETTPFGEGTFVTGVADITPFESLSLSDAEHALQTVVTVVEYILRAGGVSEKNLPWGVSRWTGIHPIERGYTFP